VSALERDDRRQPSGSSSTGDPRHDARLNALLDDIAEGRPIDWPTVAREYDLSNSVLQQYRLLAEVAAANRQPDSDSASSTSLGHVMAAASTHAPPDLASGIPWGPLRRLERVGSGAYGDVYRAYYPELETIVALKILHKSKMTIVARGRAAADARLLARIRHPNVVTVHGAMEVDGELGVWMDFIEGRTLDQIVKSDGTFSGQEALAIGESLCDALAEAHKREALHRDIKAENVMREKGGKFVLLDFGIGGDIVTADGAGVGAAGTPLYMAPELFYGAPASVQTDIYSLGVLLFYLVTGTFPVTGRTSAEVRDKQAARRRVLLADVRPGLPKQLLRIVERATAFDPADRYPSAGAMLADFDVPLQASSAAWRSRTITGAIALFAGAAGPYLLGRLTTADYNLALGRVDPFGEETIANTWVVGQRLLVPPLLYVVVLLLLYRAVSAVCRHLVMSPLGRRSPIRQIVGTFERVGRLATTSEPRQITDLLLLAQLAIAVGLCWTFWPVVSAATAKLTETDPALLAPLRYGGYSKHAYTFTLCAALLVTSIGWTRLLRRHGPARIGLVNTSVGVGLIALLLMLLALPYRLIFMNQSQRADYQGMRCYVTDSFPRERPDQYLLYCPDAPVPKVRTARLSPSLILRDEIENIFTRRETATSREGEPQ
jgi:tRNA A-37 threonylcarbamoyl transferase component Bud32